MDTTLTIAINSRALFDLSESNDIYENDGLEAYRRYQIEHEEDILAPGEAFPIVKKLLNINSLVGEHKVEVILLSRNSADTGLRIFNSIKKNNLDITRAAFCGGGSPYRYVSAFGCNLFLSTNPYDVAQALKSDVGAATVIGSPVSTAVNTTSELKIAFDGDAVIFSDEAERVYQADGLDAFSESEARQAIRPLEGGPFKSFLAALHNLQKEFGSDNCPIRTALVTARSAPAHERVIRTLRAWDIRIDESLFLGGMTKTKFLKSFGADIFFDDQRDNCDETRTEVTTGHVPNGIINE